MLTDVCPAGCRAILSRNKKRRATLSASYFGQLKAAGYLSWQPAPHKMGEGIRNPYGEQRTDSNRPSSRRPRTRPQMGTGVVSFHVFSKLERRTRHATAGCLISVLAGGQTHGQTARTAGALGQGHAPTPGRLPGYGCGCENGGAHRACAGHYCGGSGGVGVGWPALLYRSPPLRGMGIRLQLQLGKVQVVR